MIHWLRDHHRSEIRERQFPVEWEAILRANVMHFRMLEDAERTELCAMVQVLLEEKNWEGCGGLELTDEIRVTIAAEACLLQLGLPHDYFRNVDSILVYPNRVTTWSTMSSPTSSIYLMELPTALRHLPIETCLPNG